MLLLLTMVGAAVGAPSRWLIDQYVQTRHDSVFPWGTLVINVAGSLLLGALLSLGTAGRASLNELALAGTGFCGGFTTFSTFGYETVRLAEEGSIGEAILNVLGSVTLGLLASVVGWQLVQAAFAGAA